MSRMAAVEWNSGEELIIELPCVRHSKKDGVLYVTNQRLAWAEYSAKEFKFQCGFSRIKCMDTHVDRHTYKHFVIVIKRI